MMIGLQNPAMLGLLLAATPLAYTVLKADETEKKVVGAAKIAAIALLAIGAASPYVVTSEKLSEQPTVTVLVDESTSTDLMKDYSLELEGVETERRTIASGNSSELKEGIMRNIEDDTPYLIISDGQSEEPLSGLASKFRQRNSTLHSLKPEMEKDSSVSIEGPESTVTGAENSYTVEVKTTDTAQIPKPTVEVDGEEINLQKQDENTYSFTKEFSNQQDHTIEASIETDDGFSSNNQYFKTVDVTDKPEVLVLGQEGGLESELEEFYDLTYAASVPEDLSEYYSVIAKGQFEEQELAGYITEGNGLVYTGDYEQENEILPVREADRSSLTESTKTILSIDNSGAIRTEGGRSKIKEASEVILSSLRANSKAGAVAYKGTEPQAQVLDPRPLSDYRGNIAAWIRDLQPESYSPHQIGLNVSRKMIGDSEGNIILITDGELPRPREETHIHKQSFRIAEDMDAELIIVGVIDEEPAHGGERFLKQLKRRSGGQYYPIEDLIDENGNLEIELTGGGGGTDYSSIVVVNSDHFITSGVSLESSVGSIDIVKSKPESTQLVKTANGNPFLTTWRYGLGRVAAFSAGSKDLGSVSATDPELVSRTLSWAVGQPQRKEEETFRVSDARQGEPVEAEASYPVEGLNRQGENLYTAEIQPEGVGFHEYEGDLYGYSYTEELEEVGYSRGLDALVESTGGRTFSPGDEEEIISEVQKFNNRDIKTEKPLSDYFILGALIVFLSEVGYRKLKGRK